MVGLDEVRAGGHGERHGCAGGVDGDPGPAPVHPGDETGIQVDRGTGRQAAATDDPGGAFGRGQGGLDERLDLCRGELGPWLVELGGGAVGLEDADVHPDAAGDGDAAVGDTGSVEELVHEVSLGTPGGEHGQGRGALRGEGTGHVDALAARVDATGGGAVHLAAVQGVDDDGPVDARVGGEGDDHAVTTSGPAARSSAATSSARSVSVTTTSTSARVAKRWRWSSPALLESVATSTRRAE